MHESSGTISAVDVGQRTIKVRQLLFAREYNLASDCAIALGNKTQSTLADLKPGMEVKVRYTDTQGVLVASQIDQAKEIRTGSVKLLDVKDRKLALDEGAFTRRFRVGDDCRFVMEHDKSGSLNDLQVGQRIRVEYVKNGDTLEAIKVEQPNATAIGTLNAIDADADTVKIKNLLSNQKFNLADDCRIVINGKPDGKLSDLRLGQKVAIDYRDVNGVYVATRIAHDKGVPPTGQAQLSQAAR
jgi:hypothetical protein